MVLPRNISLFCPSSIHVLNICISEVFVLANHRPPTIHNCRVVESCICRFSYLYLIPPKHFSVSLLLLYAHSIRQELSNLTRCACTVFFLLPFPPPFLLIFQSSRCGWLAGCIACSAFLASQPFVPIYMRPTSSADPLNNTPLQRAD